MSSTRPSLGRLLRIHALIARHGYPTLTQLAEHCSVHTRTIERDLVTLRRDYSAPLAYSKQHEGYYYRETFQLAQSPFSEDELVAMVLGLSLIESMPNFPFNPALRRSLTMLHSWLPEPLAARCQENSPPISYTAKNPPASDVETDIIFRNIVRAIMEKRTVRVTLGGRGESIQLIDPYQICMDAEQWVLHGRSHTHNKVCTFPLAQMTAVQILSESFATADTRQGSLVPLN